MRGRCIHQAALAILLMLQIHVCLATEDADINNTRIYYVALDGNDTNPGNLKQPFKTLQKAIEVVRPGNAIYVRGGTYHCDKTIVFDKSGKEGKPIWVWAYGNGRPVFDFSMGKGEGFLIKAAYWHLKGLSVTGAELQGISLKSIHAHHNIVEYVTTYGNELSGVWLKSGAAYNLVVNCDSHHNFDPATNGQNADGFAASSGVGLGNIFRGCRAWNNADDGFDFFRFIDSVRAELCFAWRNGQNVWGHPLWEGNSNGFKIWAINPEHVLVRCVAWDHAYRGIKGTGVIHNCTMFRNLAGYSGQMNKKKADRNVRNNISWPRNSPIRTQLYGVHNSWNQATGVNLTLDDFLSTDDSVITGPRNTDGSLPVSDFLKLAPSSDAIDAGIDVGLPYVGKAPDLGAFEYTYGNGNTDQSSISKENVDGHEAKVTHIDPRLLKAAEKGELDTIKRLINEGATEDKTLTVLLYIAIAQGDLDAVKYLIARGADVNSDAPTPVPPKGENYKELCGRLRLDKTQDNKYHWTPLHAAVSGGYPDIVEYLIDKKAFINPRDDLEWTPLHVAAWQSPDLIPLLIAHGADVHAQDFRGRTALHHAAEQGHLSGVKSLVAKGANVHTADHYGSCPLHCATCEGHTDIVKMLIACGAEVNSIDNAGRPPLYYAARWGHGNVVVFLVSKGANPNIADKWGWTPVHIASLHVQKEAIQGLLTAKTDVTLKNNRGRTATSIAQWRCKELYERFTDPGYIEYLPQAKLVFDLLTNHSAKPETRPEESQTKSIQQAAGEGDAEYLKMLLSKGIDVNNQDDTGLYTALHMAAIAGHKDVIELLIENDADVNVKNFDGQTALHIAIQRNRTEIVKLLIENGADVNTKNDDGQTPLDIAVAKNRKDIIDLLVEKGAVPSSIHVAVRVGTSAKVKSLIEKGADINAKDASGQTPLHYAVKYGRKQVADLLIAKGANIHVKDKDGYTPLHLAVYARYRDVAELLIAKGADVSSIHLAAYLGDIAKVMHFIEQGSDINAKDRKGDTPLHYAARVGSKEVSELLLTRGADIEARGKYGSTPLHWGSDKGHRDLVELLITKGADIDARDDQYGVTPLHYAVYRGHKEVSELLIAKGANIHVKDRDGYTPLHLAALAGHRNVAELLVAKGADVNAKEVDGKTPLQVAEDRGHTEIVELLKKHGAKE